jgi:hypothetical protein
LWSGWEELTHGGLLKLCIIKIFREEKLVFACQQFVGAAMGALFTEPPPWTLDDVFPDTSCRTPVIFILSTGALLLLAVVPYCCWGVAAGCWLPYRLSVLCPQVPTLQPCCSALLRGRAGCQESGCT